MEIKEFFKGIIIILIICIIICLPFGYSIYRKSYNSIIETHMESNADVPLNKDLIYGEYPLDEYCIINIISGKSILKIESQNEITIITLTPSVLLAIHLIAPTLIFFAFLMIIYLFITLIDIIKKLIPHKEKSVDSEKNSHSKQLIELPDDLSIYAILYLRFNKVSSYALRNDIDQYIKTAQYKTQVDRLYEELIKIYDDDFLNRESIFKFGTSVDSSNSEEELIHQIKTVLYDELYQKEYLKTNSVERTNTTLIKRIQKYLVDHFYAWKETHDINNDNEVISPPLKRFRNQLKGSILGLIVFFIIAFAIMHSSFIIIFTFFVILLSCFYYSTIPNYTSKGKRLTKQLIDYEKNCLSLKNPSSYTPKEKLYMSVLLYIFN